MKTWWNCIPLIIGAIIIPFIAGILPTIKIKNNFYGGGVVRETAVNLLAEILPLEAGNKLVSAFIEGSIKMEILLYLPIAINLSAIALVIAYCLSTIWIESNNLIKTNIYKSKRQRAKGA